MSSGNGPGTVGHIFFDSIYVKHSEQINAQSQNTGH